MGEMTPERLEEIKARCEKATPGEWKPASAMPLAGHPFFDVVVETAKVGEICTTRWAEEHSDLCGINEGRCRLHRCGPPRHP